MALPGLHGAASKCAAARITWKNVASLTRSNREAPCHLLESLFAELTLGWRRKNQVPGGLSVLDHLDGHAGRYLDASLDKRRLRIAQEPRLEGGIAPGFGDNLVVLGPRSLASAAPAMVCSPFGSCRLSSKSNTNASAVDLEVRTAAPETRARPVRSFRRRNTFRYDNGSPEGGSPRAKATPAVFDPLEHGSRRQTFPEPRRPRRSRRP